MGIGAVYDETLQGQVEGLTEQIQDLRSRVEASDVLLGLAAILAEVKTFEETLELAVKIVADAFRADRCFAVTLDENRRAEVKASFGFDPAELDDLRAAAARPGGLPLIESAIAEKRPLLVGDVAASGILENPGPRALGAYVCIPLTRWTNTLAALGIEFSEPRSFSGHDEGLAHGVARQLAVALANARRLALITELRNFGLRLASRLKLADVVEEVAVGARELLGADSALLYFVDSGENVLVTAGGTGPAADDTGDPWARLDLKAPPWDALERGETVTLPGAITGELNAVAVRIGRPDQTILGAIVLLMKRPVPLAAEEEEALNVLAGQAALGIATATRFQKQRQVAMSLQSGLLSPSMPDIAGFDVGAVYEPAGEEIEVGGDFYDVFDLHDGRFAVVVGDVSGKGAEAAALMAMAKYMLRAFAFRNPSPSSVLFHLNNALAEALQEDRFVTLVYGVLSPESGELAIAGGGHPRPLLFRAGSGTVDLIPVHGTLLGAFMDQHYEQELVHIADGDVFAAYTDGLIEARSADGGLYGIDEVAASLVRHAREPGTAVAVARSLFGDAQSFGTIFDDTVVVALTKGTRG